MKPIDLEKHMIEHEALGVRENTDDVYVNESGDTMTGPLTIIPSSGATAITASGDIIAKAGKKVIYDG